MALNDQIETTRQNYQALIETFETLKQAYKQRFGYETARLTGSLEVISESGIPDALDYLGQVVHDPDDKSLEILSGLDQKITQLDAEIKEMIAVGSLDEAKAQAGALYNDVTPRYSKEFETLESDAYLLAHTDEDGVVRIENPTGPVVIKGAKIGTLTIGNVKT